MQLWELFVIAVGLSMDAFAVSVCKGLSVSRVRGKHVLLAGVYFGGFQAMMPYLGYVLGAQFQNFIMHIDHWIAFILLVLIGWHMVREAKSDYEMMDDSFGLRAMLPLAVATSIDALAVGISFAFLKVQIIPAVCFIGSITFLFSALGVKIGNLCGAKLKSSAERLGGGLLIVMGIKILLEHLGFLG